MRRVRFGMLVLAAAALLLVEACGGGGGGGSAGPAGTPTRTPTRTLRPGEPTFTATRTVTPVPTATAVQVQPSPGGTDILGTIRNAPPGAVVAIPAGVYPAFVLRASDLPGPLTIVADTSGAISGLPAGNVTIQANNSANAILLEGVSDLTLQGFTVRGATVAGIEIRDSFNVTVRDFVAADNPGHGVRLVRSTGVRLWNNLVFQNTGAGVFCVGSDGVQVINHTIYGNRGGGLIVGDSLFPSANFFVRNNILIGNRTPGILVHPTTIGFDSNFNLNRDGYDPADVKGANDFSDDPLWRSPGTQDGFRIPGTTDECLGGSSVLDAGDDAIDPELIASLRLRTTQTDNKPDCIGEGCCPPGCIPGIPGADCAKIGRVDLGYHYEIR